MHWKAKAFAFRVLGLPGGAAAHRFLQRRVTKTFPRSEKWLDGFWGVAESILSDWAKHKTADHPTEVLEVGAGRDLAVPLALRMMGVPRVVASDVTRLARLDLTLHAARHMAHRAGVEPPTFQTWADLDRLGISYRAPDVVKPPYSATFDCSFSNGVLEHVSCGELPHLLRGLKVATKPGGLSVHLIDYSDHYARSDSSLSRFNFLKFTDKQWAKYNSGLQHVNRLRHSDYVRLFQAAGFIVAAESAVAGEPVAEISANLAPRFRPYNERDLFTLEGRIVAIA